ncbi:hypothetical protein M9H77_33069 [Catharanthus roseus]|uniref:Uncharacterized protein n=1 Tax=Catharanthus roseus TaxID=4058 RepID=A0ACC0A5Y1_CATRO|nr:hypothetical protein M9H77_33069 [Catharanthus roseus]
MGGEIEREAELNRLGVEESSCLTSSNGVEIILKVIGPFPSSRLIVPSSIKVRDLRNLIAQSQNSPVENLKLIWRGNVLQDEKNGDDVLILLNSGDSLIVAAKPKPPPKHIKEDLEDDEDDELRFRLPQTTSRWKRKLFSLLRNKLKFPDVLLMALFSISLKMWGVILLWFILAPVANRWEVGPLYILGTGFAIIFYNLGKRQPGDVSAYSIFNDNFRELPGTLNADRLDRDIRAGQF